ncbi:MAG TPA: hypothetical protein VH082_09655 [Rudaea sp.]|jgi:uncharacterized membrane protein|nr:hypothetical protein [Rudaea sp.]
MSTIVLRHGSVMAAAIFAVLDPIVYGFFAGALIFDAIYFETGEILWDHSAAWLITFGLFIAIIPRLINLVQVWITARAWATGTARLDFWLNLVAIVLAVFNALVHSRDAYASMPAGLWLSIVTVILLSISHAAAAVRDVREANRHA